MAISIQRQPCLTLSLSLSQARVAIHPSNHTLQQQASFRHSSHGGGTWWTRVPKLSRRAPDFLSKLLGLPGFPPMSLHILLRNGQRLHIAKKATSDVIGRSDKNVSSICAMPSGEVPPSPPAKAAKEENRGPGPGVAAMHDSVETSTRVSTTGHTTHE